MEDDQTFEELRARHQGAEMSADELKLEVSGEIEKFLQQYQKERTKVTAEQVARFKDYKKRTLRLKPKAWQLASMAEAKFAELMR